MILVDSSVWVDHLRSGNAILAGLLSGGAVLAHPWVTGEVALGNLKRRGEVVGLLQSLPQAKLADNDEVLGLIEREALHGAGIGYVDAQLLASTRLTDAALWTRDRCLSALAERLGLGYESPPRPAPRR